MPTPLPVCGTEPQYSGSGSSIDSAGMRRPNNTSTIYHDKIVHNTPHTVKLAYPIFSSCFYLTISGQSALLNRQYRGTC